MFDKPDTPTMGTLNAPETVMGLTQAEFGFGITFIILAIGLFLFFRVYRSKLRKANGHMPEIIKFEGNAGSYMIVNGACEKVSTLGLTFGSGEYEVEAVTKNDNGSLTIIMLNNDDCFRCEVENQQGNAELYKQITAVAVAVLKFPPR